MDNYHIRGGNVLRGKVKISGAKNAALPILAASVMTKGDNLLMSCPDISDVASMTRILKALGCSMTLDGDAMHINADGMNRCRIPDHLMKEMRSSVFLAGSLLTRCGEAVISNPGGCDIGKRPIDIHIDGLRKLGAFIERTDEHIIIKAGKLKGKDIALSYPSVGATENIMMAAIAAEGTTRIINCAREPEIEDLQNYINSCGGRITGAGTGIITIEGRAVLNGCRHKMIPDRIEAGTYLIMGLGTGGDILLEGIGPETLMPLIKLLKEGGYDIQWGSGHIRACAGGQERLRCEVDTAPYPGFPTDLQPQITALLAKNGAGSVIRENIFEKRLDYVDELKKMGADIEISEKKAIINSNNILCGTEVIAKDLRGGAALVIAGLMAEGETKVANTKYIKRGYCKFKEKIIGLGGEITEDEC